MQDLIHQLLNLARGMWRYRWHAAVVAWVVAVVGAVVVFQIPDRYQASARVYVDTQSILKPLLSGLAVQPNVEQQVAMLSRTLISRPNIEKLVRMADLDLQTESKAQQEALISDLMQKLAIRSTARDNLYTLSYSDPDKDKAQRVVQSLVSIFVESSLGASRKDADAAKVFLNEQIKAYEAKLEEAERRLKEFRLRNIDQRTADGRDAAARLAEMSAQLDAARLQLREAEHARDAARRQLEQERARAGDVTMRSILQESALSIATPEIDARLQAQRTNLDGLLQRYTEQHPDVIATRRLIAELEAEKEKQVAELRRAALAAPAPVYSSAQNLVEQELNRVLAASEVQVASLKARVAEYTTRYEQALKLLRTSPEIEAEYAQLNRDYAIHRKNYEDLVARRETATISGELEATGVAEFRLIDPPRVDPKPVWPNRLLLLAGVLVASLGAGAVIALLLAQLRPVFHTAAELRQVTQLPLLGTIDLVVDELQKHRERRDVWRFGLASGGLVVVYSVLMAALALRVGGLQG